MTVSCASHTTIPLLCNRTEPREDPNKEIFVLDGAIRSPRATGKHLTPMPTTQGELELDDDDAVGVRSGAVHPTTPASSSIAMRLEI